MKTTAQMIIVGFLLLNLIVGLNAGLLISRNGVIYCKLSTRRSCDKTSPVCVQVTTPMTCKHYKNECQYMIDRCLMTSQYGTSGTVVAIATCAAIPLGSIGTC